VRSRNPGRRCGNDRRNPGKASPVAPVSPDCAVRMLAHAPLHPGYESLWSGARCMDFAMRSIKISAVDEQEIAHLDRLPSSEKAATRSGKGRCWINLDSLDAG
jgi:hypothetical protein